MPIFLTKIERRSIPARPRIQFRFVRSTILFCYPLSLTLPPPIELYCLHCTNILFSFSDTISRSPCADSARILVSSLNSIDLPTLKLDVSGSIGMSGLSVYVARPRANICIYKLNQICGDMLQLNDLIFGLQ